MSREEVTLPPTTAMPSESMAQILKSSFVSKRTQDIMASTELREHEIYGFANIVMTAYVNHIRATYPQDLKGLVGLEKKLCQERLRQKVMMDRNPNGMVNIIQDVWMSAYLLLRKSLKRKSLGETVVIATSPRQVVTPAQNVGVLGRVASTLGISRRYKRVTVEKE